MFFGDLALGPSFGDPDLARAVLGDVALRPVTLDGAALVRSGALWGHQADPDGTAEALLCSGLSAEATARFEWLMAVMGLAARHLATGQGHVIAFQPRKAPLPDVPVSPALLAEALPEIMAAQANASAAQTHARLGQMFVRAASRLRAKGEAGTPTLPARPKVSAERYPYSNYFTMIEQDIAFPRFDGTLSDTVNRAAFVSGDAVTILPYDPPRDRVLVVEQFRFAPWLRGSPNPWTVEAIAGRIDPGESPEEAGRREAVEEAGLTLGRLHHVGNYYPSPGAVTEYLYSYVAEADLPDGCAGLGGEEAEHEDIRALLWSFDELMEAVRNGRLQNGPALLSALWLQINRDRLQAGA